MIKVPEFISKVWGNETIIEQNDDFIVKIIRVRAGHRLSEQYHQVKKEVIFVHSGVIEFELNGETSTLTAGQFVIVYPGEIHRLKAITDAVIFEPQTAGCQLDVVRTADDYGRTGTNQP